MKLSIIILSYNESRFLEKAVGSCLDQDYDDYEIIIGDDGSDDGSVDIIKRYAETNNIKYFVMERNAKYYIPSIRVSDIIKRALEIADGQYVCVLSGDDFLLILEGSESIPNFLTHTAHIRLFIQNMRNIMKKAGDLMLQVHTVIGEVYSGAECMRIYRALLFGKRFMKTISFWIKCVTIQA